MPSAKNTTHSPTPTARANTSSDSTPTPQRHQSRWPLLLSLGTIASIIALYFISAPFQAWANEAWDVLMSGDQEQIEAWVKQYGWWGPVLIVTLMVGQMFLIVAPTWALVAVAVLAYGPWLGVPLCAVAVCCASSVGYWIGASLSDVTVDRMVGEKNRRRLEDIIERHGFGAVVLFRLSPFLSNDAISFIAGLVRMGYFRYIVATLAGTIPLAATIGIVGQNADELKWPLIILTALGIVAYLPYIAYCRGWFRRSSETTN